MTQRVALVTGVGGGIGRATATSFANAGWRVVGTDVRDMPHTSDLAFFSRCDVSKEADVDELVSEVERRFGRLDTVVNNAAIQIAKPIVDTTLEEWDMLMAVNVRAAFITIRKAYPLLASCRGSIVNVSSVHAIATSSNIACYAASKGALLALSRALAIELASGGVRVNAILPGAVDTGMLRAGLSRGHVTGETVEQRLEELAHKTVIGRVADPVEIARVIVFLADGTQSSFITGQALVVDGGATARLSTE
jgi:NAD(P)-dependent dehydrogenase (short-subunit alcohol dehydrogenase family)